MNDTVNPRLLLGLESSPIVYITKDIERALGLPIPTPGYYIVSNDSTIGREIADRSPSTVFLVKSDRQLSTRELVERKDAQEFVKGIPNAHVVVFKNTGSIEKALSKSGMKSLMTGAAINNSAESKIDQTKWLGKLAELLPPHKLTTPDRITWKGVPFILQWNNSHSGRGTHYVESDRYLKRLKEKFPVRPCRVSKYIEGPAFTNNNVAHGSDALISNISYQITGLPPLGDRAFETVGNDWALARKLLTQEQRKEYRKIVNSIASRFCTIWCRLLGRSLGPRWYGMFGVDMVLDEKTGKLYLIEVNARQPASAVFESKLQREARVDPGTSLTIFEAHLMDLLRMKITEPLTEIRDGARLQDRRGGVMDIGSPVGIMARHSHFNEVGIKLLQDGHKNPQ